MKFHFIAIPHLLYHKSKFPTIWFTGITNFMWTFKKNHPVFKIQGKHNYKNLQTWLFLFPQRSVEIWDGLDETWRTGASLPVAVYGSPMIEHPNGGAVVIAAKHLYLLPHAKGRWELMGQRIKHPRIWITAFLVPDDIVRCT